MHGRYLKAIQEGGVRYALDGVGDGYVTEQQQQYASEELSK
jgi:sRNA-binding protein